MFQAACKSHLATTMPIVIARRMGNGKLQSGIGAAVMLNEEGWFITASHILQEIKGLHDTVQNQQASARLSRNQRRKLVTHYVVVVGGTNAQVVQAVGKTDVDIGAGRLEGFSPPANYRYPRLRTREVEQGELLCRLGFPFAKGVEPTWDKEENGFVFTNLFPVPLFANEGLVSRFVALEAGARWIETSSPGLMGQSGGPVVDADGLVCGIQVNTEHYPLGFKGSGRNQVLNVGRAVHVETVRSFLDEHKIAYRTEED